MISIAAENGTLLRKISGSTTGESVLGFHPRFGFVDESSSQERSKIRRMEGLSVGAGGWLCKFKVLAAAGGKFAVQALEGCQVEKTGTSDSTWKLITQFGNFLLSSGAESQPFVILPADRMETSDRILKAGFALAVIAAALIPLLTKKDEIVQSVALPVPITVQVREEQKPVQISAAEQVLNKILPKPEVVKDQKVKRAIADNLGFLGLLGRKDLKKALGGAPTMKDASAGAGAGGNEGSGGEMLQGLGQGLHRTTVGNSGVAGLGGVGTKGAGGGAGGYGNASVGSGEGRSLTSMATGKDMVLEGGLDRSVIQATIAKYLSQVRACYERGLQTNPELSGQVSMHFEINAAGQVATSRVERSSLDNKMVEGCIATRMLTWMFPKPLGGVLVKVNYPFLLRPSGR